MTTLPLVTSQSLAPVAKCLSSLSLPVDRWLSKARVPADVLFRPDGLIPLHGCYRFLHLAVSDEHLQDLPVLLSENLSPLELGSLGRALRNTRTVGEYLRVGTRMIGTHSNSGASMWLTREGDLLRVHQRVAPADGDGPAIVDAYTLAMTLRFLRRVLGARWRPVELELRAGSEHFLAEPYLCADSCVLTGRRDTSFALPVSLTVHRVPVFAASEPSLVDPVDAAIPTAFPAVLERLVQMALDEGQTDLRLIADWLGMSPRALQRRFAGEGTDYRSLLTRCRIERAKLSLATTNSSIASIASELGYTDASNFARAFRKSTGSAPAAWRCASAGRQDRRVGWERIENGAVRSSRACPGQAGTGHID
jgi:AraC-like DNA-binding protein